MAAAVERSEASGEQDRDSTSIGGSATTIGSLKLVAYTEFDVALAV